MIYPLNQPKRDYQFNIGETSLFENTLVARLPGLETCVAGVVMLNCESARLLRVILRPHTFCGVSLRWFPEGKVIFVAPSKPLVSQQIDACHKTCGYTRPGRRRMTGEITKPNRARLVRAPSLLVVG